VDWPFLVGLVAGIVLIALAAWLIVRLGSPRDDG
jgi:hypothetical protein